MLIWKLDPCNSYNLPLSRSPLLSIPNSLFNRYSWKDLITHNFPPGDFILNPYIPRSGKVLLYGGSSVGKTPLLWHMAACVSEGIPFFGLPTLQTPVLYIEMDSTERGTANRLRKATTLPPNQVEFVFIPGLDLPNPEPALAQLLLTTYQEIKPGLVIVSPLLKAHSLDDKDSATVRAVYGWFDKHMKDSAVVFIHHEKKHSTSPDAIEIATERFSGNQNWFNLAQGAMQLQEAGIGNLKLHHRKGQETEKIQPLPLSLDPNGTDLTCPLFDELTKTKDWLDNNKHFPSAARDKILGKILNASVRTARRRRAVIEAGLFPGPGFVGGLRELEAELMATSDTDPDLDTDSD